MELNKYIEKTNLKNNQTLRDIESLCDEAIKNNYASVSVSPYYVSLATSLLKDTNIIVNTCISYPSGVSTLETKSYEAIEAINKGCESITLVINIAAIKNEDYDYLKEEIEEIRDSIDGKTLKVAFDASLLTNEEIKKVVQICNDTFIHYIQPTVLNKFKKETLDIIKENKIDLLEIAITNVDKNEIDELIDLGVNLIGISDN